MSKLYLDVQVPGTAKTYEFAVEGSMRIGKIKQQFISQVSMVEGREIFAIPNQVLFCSKALQGLLQDEEILSDMGVQSGDTIILL